jgi:Protein of unknown function (DUF3455)
MIYFRFPKPLAPARCLVAAFALLGGCDRKSSEPTSLPAATDGGCPAAWLEPPKVSPSIAVPDGGTVLAHGAATGTQDYECQKAADGGTTWALVGPRASLKDCTGALLAEHFPSDAGAALPEWQSPDGAYVVGHKVAAFTPDLTAGTLQWILLEGVSHGGVGTLSRVGHVQRVHTTGGVAPAGSCGAGATARVPYTADYYFYGP